ncbi:MAG: copper amine oxidase N-terminal domain-containing protein [Defluviitaleaceae bacterium]|nr:copper amine oxidase N-terminal domain-containing protein [Defluviitaleaceae bacterium]
METDNKDLICMSPVESYEAPQIPTFGDARNNPVLLKKLPSRWQKNAKVIASIGLMGSMIFSGYSYSFAEYSNEYNGQSGYSRYSNDISVILNGMPIEFDVAPVIINDRTMVPFRAIFEALGMTVEWDEDTGTAIGIGENLRIALPIDGLTAFVNADAVELDAPALLHNGRTLVPIRFVAENSGANVEWDEATGTVVITTDGGYVEYPEYHGYSDFDLDVRLHHGGAGSPFYLVHLTEQEALNIIRRQLESAGLNFDTTPPEYTALNVGLNLFDEEKGVAIVQIDWRAWQPNMLMMPVYPPEPTFMERLTEGFAQQTDISVGIFRTPAMQPAWLEGWSALNWHWSGHESEPRPVATANEKAEARAELEMQLIAQIQEFITYLQSVGILQ